MTSWEKWRDVRAFMSKVLKTGLISRTAAAVSCAYLNDPSTKELYRMVDDYKDQQSRIPVEAQKAVIRRLVEAGDAESMLQLVRNKVLSAHRVNETLEAIDPRDFDEIISQCQCSGTQGQERDEKHHMALKFTEQLLSSGIVNWMTAWSAMSRFDFEQGQDYVALFCEYESRLPRQAHSALIQALEYALEAETSEDLEIMVESGVLPLSDLNEMLVVLTHDPRKLLDYIQDLKWSATVETNLAPYFAQVMDNYLEDDYGCDDIEDEDEDDGEADDDDDGGSEGSKEDEGGEGNDGGDGRVHTKVEGNDGDSEGNGSAAATKEEEEEEAQEAGRGEEEEAERKEKTT